MNNGMDSIHHGSVIPIKFTASPIFLYLGCATLLQQSIINQERISPSRGQCAVYPGHSAGRTTPLRDMTNAPQCAHCWILLTAYGCHYGVGSNIESTHAWANTLETV